MRQAKEPHHTKFKGDLGVLKAQVDLYEQGFTICLPQTEHAPFDLVAYRDGAFRRVQVKYRAVDATGALQVRFRTNWADRHGVHESPLDKDEVDIFCIYCPDTDACYYLEPGKFKTSVTLRVESPKNSQLRRIKFAERYRRAP